MSKKTENGRVHDPQAEREAARYARPIPSREAILELLTGRGRILKFDRLGDALGLSEKQDLTALRRRLNAMARDGQLVRNRRDGFGVAAKMDLLPGRIIAHPDGFGFLRPDAGGEDLFLAPKQMRSVLHGDRVLACIVGVDRRGRHEGSVVEVLERANHQLVGHLYKERGINYVVADDRRIHQDVMIPPGKSGSAAGGDVVLVRIIEQPDAHRQPLGEVVEILGGVDQPGMAVEIAARSHGLPMGWSEEVERELAKVPSEVDPDEFQGRKDLRSLPFVTIDGEDARDFDDALYCEELGEGWRLWVAIADVSAYVHPDTGLDEEAYTRGTSAYFPGRVIPMLPEELSNGLCSLMPEQARLAMVCQMEVGKTGKVTSFRFYRAIIESHARLTYRQVWEQLSGRATDKESSPAGARATELDRLHALYQALLSARQARGALDFDSTEVKFIFDEEGQIADLQPVHRNDAHRMIEECMVAANVCAARYLEKNDMPCPFRVHETPPQSRLEELKLFLEGVGLRFAVHTKPSPRDFANILAQVVGRDDRQLIETVLLRSQNMAVYQCENRGHFGLALESYAHFTSPIRRYPDLLVHRAIGHLVDGGRADDFRYRLAHLEQMSEHCSTTERRAEEASRDAEERLKCIYMIDRVGEDFDGMVTGVTSFGLFVELTDLHVSGLIHVTALPNDYYHYEPARHHLKGERGGRVFRLTDKLRVEVVRVDVDERKIDFRLA